MASSPRKDAIFYLGLNPIISYWGYGLTFA